MASESVSGALDELSPPEGGDAFRVVSAAAEPTEAPEAPLLVATFTAPTAESLPDGADGVRINAGQVEAGQAMTMEIDAPAAELDSADGDSEPDLVGAIGPEAGGPEAATAESADSEDSADDETDSEVLPTRRRQRPSAATPRMARTRASAASRRASCATTRSRRSFAAGRSCWSRWSRRNAAPRARP